MKFLQTNLWLTLLALSSLLFSGCAVKRGEVTLQAPVKTEASVPLNGQEIYINSVVDRRMFQVKPPQPNIPSLDPSATQSDEIKARAVGRKRNGYGMALGDILLNEGQTVNSVIKNTFTQALKEKGYRILDTKEQITPKTYVADINIMKFWSWMNPGFFAITISSEIETIIKLKKADSSEPYTLYAKAADTFQTGMESNYIEIMEKSLKAYAEKVKEEIK